ncbi:twin-arginine translocase subunit TatC [Lentisphaerota bacterium ZTH]|nr:twin-arginine translocase subunit TatC [Lentisphaerota bacterium]WET07617.1 twin-arginine translocase subunit TatC [Lentisphaerota bacterium ZTH]
MVDRLGEKSFLAHLEELRWVLLRGLICIAILFPLTFWLAPYGLKLLVKHSCPAGFTLKYFTPLEPLFVRIKLGLLLAFFIGIPYIAVVLWGFIIPGLYCRERFWLGRLAVLSWLLFICGIVFSFLLILPAVMSFSLSMQTQALQPAIGINSFVSLTGFLLLGFGVMFQLPIAVFLLVKTGLVKLETFKRQRPLACIVILTLSAILTPPDVFSQVMMAVPSYLLFELSLLLGRFAKTHAGENADLDKQPEPVMDFDCQEFEVDSYKSTYEKKAAAPKRKLRSNAKRR